MKQYKVLKEMINAPVGTILRDGDNGCNTLYLVDNGLYTVRIIDESQFGYSVSQGFIEPYTPEPKHWRANKYTTYYYVCTMLDTIEARADQQLEFDNNKYNSGNYFKSQATAELVAKAQKLFFELLHDTESTYMNFIKLEKAIKEAKKAVEEDDSNEWPMSKRSYIKQY